MPSTAIRAIDYDASLHELYVTFVTGRAYAYERVPVHVYEAFEAADSKGAFFNHVVRDRYAHRELLKQTG
jgi:hypothetical protein